MLKRIPVEQLAIGMHIAEFCGSWLDHPFWRNGFVLARQQDLDAIRSSKIREVVIDCSQGSDVAPARAQISETPLSIETAPVGSGPPAAPARLPVAQELAQAAKICEQAKDEVISMFQSARMGQAIRTDGAHDLVEAITDSVNRNPSALISLARLKTIDDYTYMHSVAVSGLMVALARQLGLGEEETRNAGIAGLLHDLGKATTPLDVLNKPGKLSDQEFGIMRQHPEDGHRMLLDHGGLDDIVLDVCLNHHEKVDGSGYPHHADGRNISLYAKMCAVCDVYDAITSDRPYKAAWPPAESLRKMAEWAEGHFDQKIFQAFVKSLGIYPVGSLVRLASGRLGVVVEQSEASLLKPRVKVFFSSKANTRIRPEIVDLGRAGCPDQISGREDPAHWHFPDFNELWMGQLRPAW